MPASVRRLALAVTGGLLLYAGHPPLDVGLAGPLALVPLLALARDLAATARPGRSGLRWGFLAGLVFLGPMLWFIARFGVVPWALLTVIEALSVAAFVAGLALWGDRPGRGVAAVVWWVALEAARSQIPFGGFTWGVLGYTQHDGGLLLPAARSLGVLGVSGLCAALAAAAEEALHRARRQRHGGLRGAGVAALPPLSAGGAVLALAAALTLVPPPAATGRSVDIASVQAADIQASTAAGVAREDVGRIVQVAEQMVLATRPLAADPPDVTVWPENALDADVTDPDNTGVRDAVARALDLLGGRTLLAGVFLDGPRPRTHVNAMVELTPAGAGEAAAKRHPVPFAEYIPARSLFAWYPALDVVTSDMVAGERPVVFDVGGARIGTVLCFDSTFPPLVREQVLAGAEVLVVSTNNSSWGRSPASAQHLAYSQLRAVETGRHVLHGGLSGISAVVDPEGRVSQRTEIFDEAVVRADLPLIAGLTPAMRVGDLVGRTAMALSAAGLGWLLIDRRRRRRASAQQDD